MIRKDALFSKKKILFIIGSQNQASQMHQIASRLPAYDCFFSQLYSRHPIARIAARSGLLDTTVLGGEFKRNSDAYLQQHRLRNDYAASVYDNRYDMAVVCTDLLVPGGLRKLKTVWVQEGMTDPVTPWGSLVHGLGLPGWMAMNTAYNGCSNNCDIYCAASEGYKEQFAARGTAPSRIFVTGIPNYDHAGLYSENDFPHRGYVLAATSDVRETFRKDDRPGFIRDCVQIAGGRQLIFKLHPNENKERAIAEIRRYAPPETMIYTDGNTSDMIANCDELITQYSTVVYTGIALGKKVYSYFDVEKLKKMAPIQNGGISAENIAGICRRYIEFKGSRDQFLEQEQNADYSIPLHEREKAKDCYHYSDQDCVFPFAR